MNEHTKKILRAMSKALEKVPQEAHLEIATELYSALTGVMAKLAPAPTWLSKDGQRGAIAGLADNHLLHAIEVCRRLDPGYFAFYSDGKPRPEALERQASFEHLLAEARSRGLDP